MKHAWRAAPAWALLALASAAMAGSEPCGPAQVAYFNHAFAVVDAETAAAIEHSAYLPVFGVFSVSTVHADHGESWTGRYLKGRQTYLEFFGPRDLKGSAVGATGIALTPDVAGGNDCLVARLVRDGAREPERGTRTRQLEGTPVPWFDSISPREEAQALSIWAMEYLPAYLDDPRTRKAASSYSGDVSRKRYNSSDYAPRVFSDVVAVELAATEADIAKAETMLLAAGFGVKRSGADLVARDRDTTLTLRVAPLAEAGLRRVEFVLREPAERLRVERIGHSVLTIGPGATAAWVFGASAPPAPAE